MTEEPIDRGWFEDAVDRLPESVLRAKGFIRFRDDPDRCWLLQRTGRQWSLAPIDRPEITGAQIVVVALAGHPDQFNPDAWRDIELADDRN
jgi:G3E family GTPase